jgi:phosphatidylglycerol lysyltransferase
MFSRDRRAFVMFAPSGRSWLAYRGPVGPSDAAREVAYDFTEAARNSGMAPVFYEIGPGDVALMLALGMTLHKMGEAAEIALPGFSLDSPGRKRLCAAHARGLRDGLSLDIAAPPHDPALIAALREISDGWLAAHHAREKGFSVGRFDPLWLDRWPVALVRQHGRIVAFANLLPTGDGQAATLDLIRHRHDSPPETMEFLFTALILALKDRGHARFSLGMAPLSGLQPERSRRLWDRFGPLIYRHGGGFHNFAELRAFKEKFAPEWSPHYLAAPSRLSPLRPLADAARLIAGTPPSAPEPGRAAGDGEHRPG